MDSLSSSTTLLILTSEDEEAKRLISSLRSGGLAVQGIRASVPERLEELVSADRISLILCCDYDPTIDLDAWLWRCQELDLDIPLLIIADATVDSARLYPALGTEARDLIARDDSYRLQLVVARELADLEHRRHERHLWEQLHACEKRFRDTAEKQAAKVTRSWPESLDRDTGLPDRSALVDELECRIADSRPDDDLLSLIYVGIRVFPELLQKRGLSGGLAAAAQFGALLREVVPEGSYLARVADDGYVLLAQVQRQNQVIKLAASIRQKVHLPLEKELGERDATQCRTGTSFFGSITDTPENLIDAAYRDHLSAMSGPPQVAATVPSALDKIAARIERALDIDDFQLVYQPIVSLKGDAQENYSVLLRLRDDNRSLREAKEFLGAAIKSGKMVEIDRWVIRHAVAELATQRTKGRRVNFFVTLAEETIQEERLLIWICDALRDSDARGNWLTLQVLEEHARHHATTFERISEGLRKVSCRIALNRFGESGNPESSLRNLRPDFAKLTPDLAKDLADEKSKQQRLRELTTLCRDAGIKSVVTGVEDARSLTLLWTAGVDYVQGNFLQRPSPVITQPQQI